MSDKDKPEKPTSQSTDRPVDGGSSYETLNDPLKDKETQEQRIATLEKVISLMYGQLTDVKEGLRMTETVLKNHLDETIIE